MTSRHTRRILSATCVAACLIAAGCTSRESALRDVRNRRVLRYSRWLAERTDERRGTISGPLSMADSVHIALANSRDVRTIVLEKEKAGYRVRGAYAEALPTADINGTYTRLDRNPPYGAGIRGSPNVYSLQGTVSQPLYRGGLIGAGIRAAKLYALLVDEQQRGAFQTVIYDVRRAYCDALLADALARATAEAETVAGRRLDDVHKDRDAGAASDFDVLRAEVEVKTLTAEHVSARNRQRLAVASLLNLMGVSQDSQVSLSDELAYRPMHPTVEQAVGDAFRNHPELLESELAIRVQAEAVVAARSDHFPELDAFFTQSLDRPNPFDPTREQWEGSWVTGLTLNIPLFRGFRTVSAVREEKATLRQTEVALRDAEERILLAIRQAMFNLEAAAKAVESQQANIEQAREALRLAELGFKEGALKEIDRLDARRSLTRAQAGFAQALYDHALARLQFEQATGGLTPPSSDAAEE